MTPNQSILSNYTDRIKSMVEEEMRSPQNVADEFEVTRKDVYTFCRKNGIDLVGRKNYVRDMPNILRNKVDSMKADRAVEFLLDFIEAYCPEQSAEFVDEIKTALPNLTPKECQIVALLTGRVGTIVTKEMFLTSLYANSADEPEIKIIDVFICKIRSKYPSLKIETVWGRGYRLVRDENKPFPRESVK